MNSISSTIQQDTAPVRENLPRARHAPAEIYADPAYLALEKEKIFMREWLFVARVEELANPGDYMALRIMDEPVVVSRDGNGDLHAFANVCVHRGVEVAQGSGNAKRFSCPYHGWIYDLDGSLAGAPLMKGNEKFDPTGCRLPKVHLAEWGGNIFINFAPDPQPFAEFIEPYQEEFGFLHQERCRLASKIPLELDCNWKFAVENLLDIYHVRVLHAATFGAQFSADSKDINLRDNGMVTYFYKSGAPTPDGKTLFGRMPWIDDRGDLFGCTFRMPPNTHMFGRCDSVRYLVIWPMGVNKCQIICYHLFPTDRFELADFDERNKVYRDFQIAVLEEDKPMVVSLQKAMTSRNYVPGPMAALESTIHHVLNDYLDRVEIDRNPTP